MGRERGKNQGWRRKNDGVNWNKNDEGEGDGSGDGDGTKGEGGEVMMCWHLKVPGETAGEGGGERKPFTSGKHTDIWSMKERKGRGTAGRRWWYEENDQIDQI